MKIQYFLQIEFKKDHFAVKIYQEGKHYQFCNKNTQKLTIVKFI